MSPHWQNSPNRSKPAPDNTTAARRAQPGSRREPRHRGNPAPVTQPAPAEPIPTHHPGARYRILSCDDFWSRTGSGQEAGLTRLVAVFTGPLPATVGPVRSARETDLGLLAAWGRPVFAYSGAVPELAARLHATRWLVNASPIDVPGAYRRSGPHRAPHDLYLSPRLLPNGTGPAQSLLEVGPTPAGGVPTAESRRTATDPTRFHTGTGTDLPLSHGPVSIVLIPT